MTQLNRILIVGGGIGGLSAAAALQRSGFHVDLFEQAPELREAGAGVGLWPNALHSLDQLGAGDAIRNTSFPIHILGGANPSGKTLTRVDLSTLGPEFQSAACYVALRPVLLAALAKCVAPTSIHTNARATKIERLPDRIRLYLASGKTEDADLLIAADGLYSVVRPLVVGPDDIRYSGQTCFRGIAHFSPPEPNVLCEIQGAGFRGAVCPINANTVYWFTAFNSPPGKMIPIDQRHQFLREHFHDWPFGLGQAIAATPAAAMIQNDLLDRAPTHRYIDDRLALIGDAAHPTTPNLGQGANMAIDDAIVLARSLRTHSTLSAALQQYQNERLARTRLIVKRSWNFGRACLWTSPLAITLRESAVRFTPISILKKMLRWQILQTVGPL